MMAIESPTAARVARDRREPLLEPARIDPDLQRPEALLAQAQRGLGTLRRGQQHPARGVGRDPVGRPAEQRRDRQAGDLPGDVPQGRLERPVPPGVEVDRLEHPDVAGDGQRVLPDEQVLERLEPVHRVAGPDADDALVGLDPHDRHREGRPRHRIPGRRERRIERDPQALEPDRGDAHGPQYRRRDPMPARPRPAAVR